MNMMTTIGQRHCDVRMDAIRAEFGAIVAERILEAEAADFLWDARVQERYLGQHIEVICDDEDEGQDISRMAFLSLFDGFWYVGIALVDGDGAASGMIWKCRFERLFEAESAFICAR